MYNLAALAKVRLSPPIWDPSLSQVSFVLQGGFVGCQNRVKSLPGRYISSLICMKVFFLFLPPSMSFPGKI